MAAISLFQDTNMAMVTSCENQELGWKFQLFNLFINNLSLISLIVNPFPSKGFRIGE